MTRGSLAAVLTVSSSNEYRAVVYHIRHQAVLNRAPRRRHRSRQHDGASLECISVERVSGPTPLLPPTVGAETYTNNTPATNRPSNKV